MSKLNTFVKALAQGTITDFTQYLEKSPTSFREEMAARGIEVDALVAKNEPAVLAILIENGLAPEHYEEWKTHPDARVRSALALEGYWPDFFIKDKKPDVRQAVARAYHEYIPQILNRTESEWYCALHLIENNLDMPLSILEAFLTARESKLPRYGTETKVVRLRYEAMVKKVSLLEKTMAPYDLLVIDNPLWVKGVPSDVVDKIIYGYKLAQKHDQIDLFKAVFGELHSARNWVEYDHIADRVGLKPY